MEPLALHPQELAALLKEGAPLQLLDVRAPEKVSAGRIETTPQQSFINMRGSVVRMLPVLDGSLIRKDTPTVTVCGHGNDSMAVARHLNDIGGNARSLQGGMTAWMQLSVPRELSPPSSLDACIQFDRIGKGALGYLLISDGKAMIVDPPRAPGPYLESIEERKLTLIGVVDTHVHADYISGAPGIAQRYDVPYYLHPADAVYPYDGTTGTIVFTPLSDGETIPVGRATVSVMHTPGHTEGSVTLVIDSQAALTGDFLFVTSIGRPDLAGKTAEWADALWESLQKSRRVLEPDCMIYPAHYGNHAERNEDWTIGKSFRHLMEQKQALRFDDRAEFHSWVMSKEAPFPEGYKKIKSINVGLTKVEEAEADILEVGKNECALG
jgi:glyoxylase-like metal-dependent hydrolase (beta-lactamase superfamily II)